MPSPRSLILHVGLPKTGSTALQHWCYQHKAGLLASGIDYPDEIASPADPKHQFVVEALRSGAFARVERVLDRHDATSTLVLSAEGLTNQFRHFSASHLKQFRHMLAGWNVTVFIVRREQLAWTRSYYRQCLLNPRFPGHPYGTTLSFDDFAALDEVQSLYRLAEIPEVTGDAFGASHVATGDYDRDWFGTWLQVIGLPAASAPPILARANDSPPEAVMTAILAINRQQISDAVRSSVLHAMGKVTATANTVLRDYYQPSSDPTVVQASLSTVTALLEDANLDEKLLAKVAAFIRDEAGVNGVRP